MTLTGKAAVLGLSAGLLLAFSAPITAQEQEQAAVSAPERDSYLSELKRRHGAKDERAALFAESNQLLADYAMKSGYRVGHAQSKREDLNYRLSLGDAGELVVREERKAADGTLSVRNRSLDLFGIEPFVHYDCSTGQSCVLFSPKDRNPWLTIVRNPQAAQQLTRALGFLIRNLQKG